MTTDIDGDVRRLRERSDVAHATINNNGWIDITRADGIDGGPFVSYAEAVAWLIGDDHLIGMAACACSSCCYVGPR